MATHAAARDAERYEVQDDASDASVGDLVEQAFRGARDLAAQEASLTLLELEEDVRAVRRGLVLAMVAGACLSASIAWAGVALALALSWGAAGLAAFAAVFAIAGVGALVAARKGLPATILGKSRVRVERRIARVTESLR